MTEEILQAIREEIAQSIKINVNGKIDRIENKMDNHNLSHENDMARIMPVIEAYENNERRLEDAKATGKFIGGAIAFGTAVGMLYLTIKQIFQ